MAAKKRKGTGNKSSQADVVQLVREVESVKKLLVLLLAKLGADSGEISTVLELESSTVRRWIPFRKIKKFSNSVKLG